MEYIKKNQVNNKLCIPICMETPYVAPLGLFFSVVDWSKKDFEEDHQMNIPTKFIPISIALLCTYYHFDIEWAKKEGMQFLQNVYISGFWISH
jgi:hypothetical protein